MLLFLSVTKIVNYQNSNYLQSDTLEQKLPDVIVVGVKKCGTGAMIEMLKMHPKVAGQEYDFVEVFFFAHDELYDKGLDYYKVKMYK